MRKSWGFVIGLMLASASSALGLSIPADLPVAGSIAELRLKSAVQEPEVYLNRWGNGSAPGSGGVFTYTGQASCTDNGGTLVQAAGGCYARQTNGQPFNPAWFGAQCGGVQVTDGISTSGSAVVSSISGKWTAGMVGWIAVVNNAAASGQQLRTTVASYNSPTSLTLATTAGANGSAETISVFPDDWTAFINTVNAAKSAGVGVGMPAGQVCGMDGNPSNPFFRTYGSFWLNGATLWLDQTGPNSTQGQSLVFDASTVGAALNGPGTIDGLYQTNQGVAQTGIPGVQFDNGAADGAIQGNVIIQNTKGRCVNAAGGLNFTVRGLLIQNCGDYSYNNGGGPDNQTGRSMGMQLDSYDGNVVVDGFTSINAAQSGILISGFSSSPLSLHVALSNCRVQGSGYVGIDVEQINGHVSVNQCLNYDVGYTPAGNAGYYGAEFRDVKYIQMSGYTSLGTDSNALVAESTDADSNMIDWSFAHVNLQGTTANHAASAAFLWGFFGSTEAHQTLSIYDMRYDSIVFSPAASPACSTSQPQQQVLEFDQLHANQAAGVSLETNFNPQAAANSMLYILGSNSSLGTVNINSALNNNKALYFDWTKVYTNGAITFTGSATSSIAAGAISSLPGSNTPGNNSFTCP